jgi:lipid-A-disaccharide synthase
VRYYIITGEPSGDMHASNLVSELKKIDKKSVVRAWGGDRLIAEGVSLAKNIKETAFMGLWNVISNLSSIRSNLNFCKKDILDFKVDALILVDYPGFNLKIAEFAKKSGIKVFYYISPKVWAWNKSRISKIKKFVDHLIVVFPFEQQFYNQYGIEVTYVGNPLIDELEKQEYSFSYNSSGPIIALLPGSRKQEIDTILPSMLDVVSSYPNYQFIIAATNTFTKQYYQSFINDKNVAVVFNETYGLLSNSIAALVASGTATLETALLKIPQVVCYKTNWLTFIVAKILVTTRHISLVNILLNKESVKELIQSAFNKQNIKTELDIVLRNNVKMMADYDNIIKMLNKKGASKNTAKFIFSVI